MADAELLFAKPVPAQLRVPGGWAGVMVRSIEHRPGGMLQVTLVALVQDVRIWVCNHASLRADDKRLVVFVRTAKKRAIGAGMTRILRQIADGVDAAVGSDDE